MIDNTTRVLILAGGAGTRLRPLVSDLPKVMAPISGAPFLEYLLIQLKKSNFKKVTILVGYLSEKIQDYFQNGDHLGLDITYSLEKTPLGTGGALKLASENFPEDTDFLVLNGDTYFDVDLKRFVKFAKTKQAGLALKYFSPMDRYGAVELKDQKIISFKEKDPCLEDGLLNGGVYYFSRRILEEIHSGFVSLEQDVLPKLCSQGKLYGEIFSGKFIDIGIPADYLKAQAELPEWVQRKKQPGLFLDRDGVILPDVPYQHNPLHAQPYPSVIPLIKWANEHHWKVVILTNQSGIGREIFSEAQFHAFQNALLQNLINEGARVDATYFCSHHPVEAQAAFIKNCFDRKPSPGMLLKACDEHFIDPYSSVMLGDKDSDLLDFKGPRYFLMEGEYPLKKPTRGQIISGHCELLNILKTGGA